MPQIEFKTWSGNWTWPQALEADLREKAKRQAFDLEFGWMKDADHYLLGHGPQPVPWDRFVSDAEQYGDICFKAIEQRKPPHDQGKPLEDSIMGSEECSDGCVRKDTQMDVQRTPIWKPCGFGD
jgi:hypothetical protein